MALYFRTIEDAQACVDAFPEFEAAMGWGRGGIIHRRRGSRC